MTSPASSSKALSLFLSVILVPLVLSYALEGNAQTLYSHFDGSWSDANIWSSSEGGGTCSCSPSGAEDVVILHAISFGSGTESSADMTIRDTGTLTASGGTLNVEGSMTLSGALTVSGGTVNVGLTGSATDIDYDQTNVGVVPSIDVSSGLCSYMAVSTMLEVQDPILFLLLSQVERLTSITVRPERLMRCRGLPTLPVAHLR